MNTDHYLQDKKPSTRLKEVTLRKELKVGLPNYSNITCGLYLTWEVAEGEEFDYDNAWNIINQQISIQADNYDPSWIQTKEYKNKYKATINVPKQTTMEEVNHEKHKLSDSGT